MNYSIYCTNRRMKMISTFLCEISTDRKCINLKICHFFKFNEKILTIFRSKKRTRMTMCKERMSFKRSNVTITKKKQFKKSAKLHQNWRVTQNILNSSLSSWAAQFFYLERYYQRRKKRNFTRRSNFQGKCSFPRHYFPERLSGKKTRRVQRFINYFHQFLFLFFSIKNNKKKNNIFEINYDFEFPDCSRDSAFFSNPMLNGIPSKNHGILFFPEQSIEKEREHNREREKNNNVLFL